MLAVAMGVGRLGLLGGRTADALAAPHSGVERKGRP